MESSQITPSRGVKRKTTAAKAKTLPCPHCNRLFARLEHLQRHVRTHTKEKPFSCGICSKSFARSDLLVRHERLVHPADNADNRGPPTEAMDVVAPSNSSVMISPPSPHDSRMVDSSIVDPDLLSPQTSRDQMSQMTGHTNGFSNANPQLNPSWGYDLNLLSHAASHVAGALPHQSVGLSQIGEQQAPLHQQIGGQPHIGGLHDATERSRELPMEVTSTPQFQEKVPDVYGASSSLFEHGDLGDPLQDFTIFLDSVGLSSDWHSGIFNSIEADPQVVASPGGLRFETRDTLRELGAHRPLNGDHLNEPRGPPDESNSFSRFGSRLPSLQPESREQEDNRADEVGKARQAWDVSNQDREIFVAKLDDFMNVLPKGFNPPSRHTLSRFFAGYVNGFHEHLPFIHVPTLSAAKCAPEISLALAAVGAQYRFENSRGVELFYTAKAVVMEQVRRRDSRWRPQVPWNSGRSNSLGQSPHGLPSGISAINSPFGLGPVFDSSAKTASVEDSDAQMETIRALLLLTAFATWERNRELLREALAFQSILARLVREHGLVSTESTRSDDMNWEDWVRVEGDKRTKLIVYCFFNLHSIAWNVPPLLLNAEVNLNLPDSADEWKATNAAQWRRVRRANPSSEMSFQDTFAKLFSKSAHTTCTTVSPLGNYVLMHALIQQIFFARQLCSSWPGTNGSSLRLEDWTVLEHALRAWKAGWKRTPESSLDPQNPNGPVAFTSTALLGLAYIRLHVNLGPVRHLESRDPMQIAGALRDSPPLVRSPRLIMALLHSAHALSIPVRLGIDFVAKTQTFFWSIQHSLCSLECAFLLSKWLAVIPATQAEQKLSEHERKLLLWVRSMLDETEMAISPDSGAEQGILEAPLKIKQLSIAVVRVWAKTFKGNTSWAIVDLIGSSLDIYADALEKEIT